jgi:SMODS-associating 2TM, beta-strand rich effector domain
MLTRTHITIFLSLAVATWAIALLVLRLPVTWEDSKPFALTATTLSVTCVIFDKWIWKWPIFKGWLVNQPDLHGTWKVLLKSDWVNPETKQQVAPIECIMTIRQTYSRFSARLFTRESSSYLVAHKIEQHNDGVFQLFGTYQNTPDIMLRGKRSEIHNGALVLEVRGDPPKSLVGHYWTDRGTRGSLELTDRIPKILSGYQEGISRFNLPK